MAGFLDFGSKALIRAAEWTQLSLGIDSPVGNDSAKGAVAPLSPILEDEDAKANPGGGPPPALRQLAVDFSLKLATRKFTHATLKRLKLASENHDAVHGLDEVWGMLPPTDRVRVTNKEQIRRMHTIATLGLVGWTDANRRHNPTGFENIEKKRFRGGSDLPKMHLFCFEDDNQAGFRLYIKLHHKSETKELSGASKDFGKALQITSSFAPMELAQLRASCAKLDQQHQYKHIMEQKLPLQGRFVARLTLAKHAHASQLNGILKEVGLLRELTDVEEVAKLHDAAEYESDLKKPSDAAHESKESKESATVGGLMGLEADEVQKQQKHVHYMELGEEVMSFLNKYDDAKERMRFLPKLFYDYLQGLYKVTAKNIIHADIKIENLLVLMLKDAKGQITCKGRITDLGGAHHSSENSAALSGTYANYSPERANSRNWGASHLDDVFALGSAFRTMMTRIDSPLQFAYDWYINYLNVRNKFSPEAEPLDGETPPGNGPATPKNPYDQEFQAFVEYFKMMIEDDFPKTRLLNIRDNANDFFGKINPMTYLSNLLESHNENRTLDLKTWQSLIALGDHLQALSKEIILYLEAGLRKFPNNGEETGVNLLWAIIKDMISPRIKESDNVPRHWDRKTIETLVKKYADRLLDLHNEWNPGSPPLAAAPGAGAEGKG